MDQHIGELMHVKNDGNFQDDGEGRSLNYNNYARGRESYSRREQKEKTVLPYLKEDKINRNANMFKILEDIYTLAEFRDK